MLNSMGSIFSKKSKTMEAANEIQTGETVAEQTRRVMTREGTTIIDKKSNKKPLYIPNKTTPKKTTDDVLDDIVERYMKNELINNPAIPDWIERRLYKNVLKLAIGVASDTLNNTNFEVLGHNVNVSIKPKQD